MAYAENRINDAITQMDEIKNLEQQNKLNHVVHELLDMHMKLSNLNEELASTKMQFFDETIEALQKRSNVSKPIYCLIQKSKCQT